MATWWIAQQKGSPTPGIHSGSTSQSFAWWAICPKPGDFSTLTIRALTSRSAFGMISHGTCVQFYCFRWFACHSLSHPTHAAQGTWLKCHSATSAFIWSCSSHFTCLECLQTHQTAIHPKLMALKGPNATYCSIVSAQTKHNADVLLPSTVVYRQFISQKWPQTTLVVWRNSKLTIHPKQPNHTHPCLAQKLEFACFVFFFDFLPFGLKFLARCMSIHWKVWGTRRKSLEINFIFTTVSVTKHWNAEAWLPANTVFMANCEMETSPPNNTQSTIHLWSAIFYWCGLLPGAPSSEDLKSSQSTSETVGSKLRARAQETFVGFNCGQRFEWTDASWAGCASCLPLSS